MRRALVVFLLVVAGCGSDSGGAVVADAPTTTTTTTTTVRSTTTTTVSTTTTTTDAPASTTTSSITLVNGKPHFATPEAAMTYLAEAWNADDEVSLKHVTNPSARAELDGMHDVAVNLRLDRCDENVEAGDYTCHFRHDFPTTTTTEPGQTGEAVFIAGPADTPGWYMTVFESCS